MNLQKIRTQFLNDMLHIPDFIDTKEVNDYITWSDMCLLNETLLQMVTTKVFPIRRIEFISKMFLTEMDNFIELHNSFLKIIIYYDNLIDYMLETCLENELYEAAENIKNFKLYLTKNDVEV